MTLGTLVRQARPARRDFDRLVDDLISGFGLAPVAFEAQPAFRPRFEAVALENEYRVTADLPGVDPADLEVLVEDGVLTVRGQRHYAEKPSGNASDKAEVKSSDPEGGETSRVDGRGRFEQRIRFPGEIAEADVKASYKHGVLTLTVPKAVQPSPEVRTIPVETA